MDAIFELCFLIICGLVYIYIRYPLDILIMLMQPVWPMHFRKRGQTLVSFGIWRQAPELFWERSWTRLIVISQYNIQGPINSIFSIWHAIHWPVFWRSKFFVAQMWIMCALRVAFQTTTESKLLRSYVVRPAEIVQFRTHNGSNEIKPDGTQRSP